MIRFTGYGVIAEKPRVRQLGRFFRAPCRKNCALERKMNDTFFDGLGEDRTTRAGCRCEKMVFLSLFLFVFFVTLRGRRAVHSSGAQFEQAFF